MLWMERRPLKIMKKFRISPDLIQKISSDKLAQIQRINQQKWPPHSTDVTCRAGSSHIAIFDINKVLPTCATDKVKLMKYEIFTIITMTRPFVRLTSNEYVMTCIKSIFRQWFCFASLQACDFGGFFFNILKMEVFFGFFFFFFLEVFMLFS